MGFYNRIDDLYIWCFQIQYGLAPWKLVRNPDPWAPPQPLDQNLPFNKIPGNSLHLKSEKHCSREVENESNTIILNTLKGPGVLISLLLLIFSHNYASSIN